MSERLQNKMYNYEVAPPEAMWEKIASALDESEMTHKFPSKLHGIEIDPPIGAWDKIEASLESQTEAAKTKKNSVYIRYAAAAAIIGIIAFGSIKLIKGITGNKEVAQQQMKSNAADTISPSTKENITTTTATNLAAEDEKRNDAALEESKHTYAKLDVPSKSRIKIASNFYFAHPGPDDDVINDQPHYAETIHAGLSQPDTINYLTSRYITLLTTDGNLIRMSKKLMDLACCVSGEEQDGECRNQLQQWREKIACAPVNASPGNFLDIIGLINSLQDSKD
ncbi:MAG: hypothetical protein JJE22_17935 [Bacteroidia bacterium]|nr:hypothetical protein [Bacteroidia bacterium]